jgi:hypothetical protein
VIGDPTYRTVLLLPGAAVLVCSECSAMVPAGSARDKRVHTDHHRRIVWVEDEPGPIGSGPIGG